MNKIWKGILCGAALLAAGATSASGQGIEDFYKGRDLTVLIGYAPGGGYDAYARLLSQFMGAHLPGGPTLVPQNMPGAGSLKSATYLFGVAPKDGSVMGTFAQQLAVAPLLGDAPFDARQFTWIGSVAGEVSVCAYSTASPVKSWEDMKTIPHKVGGEGRGSDVDALSLTLKNLFGAKLEVITGYPGTTDMMLAVERGEIDGVCGISYGSLKSRFANLLDEGKVHVILQAGLKGAPDLTVPNAADLAETTEEKQIIRFILAPNVMGRPYAAPPGIPAERAEALRTAFDATMKDPDFLAKAASLRLEVSPVTGAEIAGLLEEIYATPKAVIEKAAEVSGAKEG
ncbi:Bug family tripartite tricarboxylate transporter substrate binding protein [Propylenella binzhouense]|uniref:Tripartite-type tricarboxylate transporter receptor subunit TctC n=1 Tax=Propylenella binzhouense TaxID=2555902 RepID=A0A964T421_9HYPH|nr:tripartite tricarboxylate transporter substrate-binding protein [Propylenella binzhouense]MYZ47552.1 hypothetical protein [Propylenella binzhouense]